MDVAFHCRAYVCKDNSSKTFIWLKWTACSVYITHLSKNLLKKMKYWNVCSYLSRYYYVISIAHPQHDSHVSSSYRSSRLGLWHCDPYAMHRGGCLELYYCNMMEWSCAIQALSARSTGFLQCFDTVGLVIWPVKIVPDMTYNVFGVMLNLAQSITHQMLSGQIVPRPFSFS